MCFSEDRWFVPLEERTEEIARGIILPSVEINDISLLKAIRYLELESKKNDPRTIGLKISTEKMEIAARIKESSDAILLARHVTLSAKDTTLMDALQTVTGLNNCILIPTIQGFRVMAVPESIDPLYTYTIPLPNEVFGKKAVPGRFGIDQAEVKRLRSNPKNFFEDYGAFFDRDVGCSFDDKKLTITLTATLPQLDLMRTILEAIFKKPSHESIL
jgi:hypothetical protein